MMGTDPVKIAIGTAILAMCVHLDGSGAVTFLLPGEGLRPSDVLASPSWEALVKDQLESTGYGEVVLKVPKLDYSDSLDLLDAAKALGIQAAFDPMAELRKLTASLLTPTTRSNTASRNTAASSAANRALI